MNNRLPRYKVARARERILPDARWDRKAWENVPSLRLDHWMGHPPSHRPVTRAKMTYDDEFLYVIFQVEDRYVRCVVTEYQGPVCTDSCVELFFTPGTRIEDGYFNLETNCGGTVLFMHQLSRGERCRVLGREIGDALAVAHSLPRRVDPEITEPVSWCVEYRIPCGALAAFAPLARPAPGVSWRANLYKCADSTSHPHWLTWARVDRPEPDFHQREFFGELEFGG